MRISRPPKNNTFNISSFLYWTILFSYGIAAASIASASATDGTIVNTNKYAWSTKAGWINFAPTNGNIHITDSAITGYAWSDLYGWINLNPTRGGVLNTAAGILSGYAWSEKMGWINFTGVTINSNGLFAGQASGTNFGILNFDCTNCSVKTDWQPVASRPSAEAAGTSGGGGFPPGYLSLPPPPPVAPTTTQQIVTTTPALPTSTTPISLPPKTLPPAPPEKAQPPTTIETIIKKLGSLINALTIGVPEISLPKIPIAKFFDTLNTIIPGLFKSQPPLPKTPIETFVARLTPPAMSGRWSYIEPKKINAFVFAPLPKEFLALEKNFPAVSNLFSKIGVENFRDLSKLKSTELHLPGLAEAAQNDSTKIPKNVIFASVADRLVDFKITLSLSKKGQPEQKISTISGKPLHLTIRPDHPVKTVTGYLIFRSRTPQIRAELDFRQILSSIFAEPVFAYPLDQPIPTEEKLVLQKFEYTDLDHDGIYTADISSPLSAGEYEIITVMDYEDPAEGSKQVRLITVVDPEGYVYENVGGNELRLPNVSVVLYRLNQATNKYEPWPGKDFGQENPQLTDVRGSYSFLVPVGTYYLTARTMGYSDYQSEPFAVQEGSGVHMNIELKSKYGWLKNIDWKTALLLIVTILLIINFYKDKKRNI